MQADPDLLENWDIVKEWNESSRYARTNKADAQDLYDAITMSRPGTSHLTPLDAYLAGFVAYTTMIGLSRRQRWRINWPARSAPAI